MSPSFGFGPERRIRRRADFLRVQGVGQRVSTPHFVLLIAARSPSERSRCSRLGIVVTKKVGNAVARARVKRLCRECFRLWPGFVPDGIELVVIAREGAPLLGLAQVQAEWERARSLVLKRCHAALAVENGGKNATAASSSGASSGAPRRAKPERAHAKPPAPRKP